MAKSLKKTPLFETVMEMAEKGLVTPDMSAYDHMSNKELLQVYQELDNQLYQIDYAKLMVKCLLRERVEDLERELAQAQYDRENAELSHNESYLDIH